VLVVFVYRRKFLFLLPVTDGKYLDPGGAFFFSSLLFITRPSGYAIVLGSRDCTAGAEDTYTNVSWLDVLCLVFLSFNIASSRVCSRVFGQRNTLYAHTWDPQGSPIVLWAYTSPCIYISMCPR
jgi:hypothetical protein